MGEENYSRMIQPASPKLCTPHHDRPVHFKLKGAYAWICLACGKQLAGPKLTPSDVDAFTQFGRFLSDDGEATTAGRPEGNEAMKLEVSMLVGPESKAWLVSMEGLLARMEKLAGVTGSKAAKATEAEETEEEEEDFGTKKPKAKKAKGFDEEEEEEEEAEEEEEEEEEAPKKKAKKKIDLDDVNDACKKKCIEEGGGKEGRAVVLKILKKNFKTESVTDLKPEQYAKAIELME